MKKRADIAVYDADYVLQLVVEIKKQPDADTQWATQMRCNLLRYEVTPNAPYFLLALSDNFYLWKNSNSVGDKALPDYIINANGVLSPYFDQSCWSLNEISQYSFEILVNNWINTLVDSELNNEKMDKELAWLFDSGLYETIKHGSVRIDEI